MKNAKLLYSLLASIATILCITACSDGTTASTDQVAASRDAQMKAVAGQKRSTPADSGAASIEAAAKANSKPAGK